ncbi:hypothetical protein H3146_21210 [Streptomyces sp. OF3]|uniref:Uncharacterized protein n=1 Tax=Streptomyces alkaliterrae TaxID=2213162 RepID=A0A7W3WP13_9ACTN|nr:DUF4344 domain-containing metallopeptidase [Streptomyces alkaliterrae]MBB1255858.1 hypothetical protein [Streptomyces alkaliterrae]
MPGRYATDTLPPACPTLPQPPAGRYPRRAVVGTLVGLTVALLCLVAVPLALLDSDEGEARADSRGFVVEYGKAGRGEGADRRLLEGAGVLEKATDRLNKRLVLPSTIRVTARSCPDAAAHYDLEKSRIEICYSFVAEVRELFERSVRDAEGAEGTERVRAKTLGVLTETVYHEAAHALIDKLGLPFTGREEDAADQFAAYHLIPQGRHGRAALLAAAENFALYAEDTDPADVDFGGEHSPDAVRAAAYYTYLYGSDPKRHARLVDDGLVGEERAEVAEDEYRALRRGWRVLLAPHLRQG